MSKNLKNAVEITLFLHLIIWATIGIMYLIMSFAFWDLLTINYSFIRLIEALAITFSIFASIATAKYDI